MITTLFLREQDTKCEEIQVILMVSNDVHRVDTNRSSLGRIMWFSLGLFFTALGLIGIPVPGLPTTPFMILAAACFAKSSQKFYDWVINNKIFGKHVKNYRETGGIPRKTKPIILTTMWIFVLFAILIAIPDSAPQISRITTFVLALIGTLYIVKIPTL